MNRFFLSCTVLILGTLTQSAFAQPPGSRFDRNRTPQIPDPLSRTLDADRDGTISSREIDESISRLRKLDSNRDGKVDLQELRDAMRGAMNDRTRGGSGRPSRGSGRGPGGGRGGSSTLESAGLELGKPIPDVAIFDDAGREFELAGLKGKHTVIVFGCLT